MIGIANAVRKHIAFFLTDPKENPNKVGDKHKLDKRTIESEYIDLDYKLIVLLERFKIYRDKC